MIEVCGAWSAIGISFQRRIF